VTCTGLDGAGDVALFVEIVGESKGGVEESLGGSEPGGWVAGTDARVDEFG